MQYIQVTIKARGQGSSYISQVNGLKCVMKLLIDKYFLLSLSLILQVGIPLSKYKYEYAQIIYIFKRIFDPWWNPKRSRPSERYHLTFVFIFRLFHFKGAWNLNIERIVFPLSYGIIYYIVFLLHYLSYKNQRRISQWKRIYLSSNL